MRFFSRPATRILAVCTANVCRSPMAEGILRARIKELGLHREVGVDSAGTHAAQIGRAPDPRAGQVCLKQGVDIRKLRARQVKPGDFERFDHILAMDNSNYDWLINAAPEDCRHRISMIGSWQDKLEPFDIPDPYYGNQEGFNRVFELIATAVECFLEETLPR